MRSAKVWRLAAYLFILSSLLIRYNVKAATLTFVSDTISNSAPVVGANHTIRFTTSFLLPPSGKITITPQSGFFSIPQGLDYTDIDFLVNGYSRQLASLPGQGFGSPIGVNVISGNAGSITFIFNNTDGLSEGSNVTVRIGTNAVLDVLGNQQIGNPTNTGSYRINIKTFNSSGALLEEANAMVAILASVSMGVSFQPATTNFYNFGVEPVRIIPQVPTTESTSTYEIEFTALKSIPLGGKIILKFPFGFSFSSSCSTVLSSFQNNDLNGTLTGTVTISSIACSSSAQTITLISAGSLTTAGDRIRFLVQGVTNPLAAQGPGTAGYKVEIKTQNSAGSTIESILSMPFFIVNGGSQSISGTIFNDNGDGLLGVAGDGKKNGSESGLADFQICLNGSVGFKCVTTATGGTYTFDRLTDGFYNLNVTVPTSTSFIGKELSRGINLSGGQNQNNVDFSFTSANRSITVNISNIPSGTDLDVFVFNPTDPNIRDFIVREVLWNGTSQRTVALPVKDGTWQVGLGPWMSKDSSLATTAPPEFNFVPPQPQQIKIFGAGTYNVSFILTQANRNITGKVLDGSGSAIANAFVLAKPANFSSEFGKETVAQSKNDGSFTLKTINGVFNIIAVVSGMPPSNAMEVAVMNDTGNASQDNNSTADVYSNGVLITNDNDGGKDNLILKILKGSRSVDGQVLDESGGAIIYAHISAEKVDSSGNPIGGFTETVTDSSGNYIIYVNDGLWKIRAFASGYGDLGSLTVTVAGSNLSSQNIQAQSSDFGTITGQVTSGGSAASGAFVNIFGSKGKNITTTDINGNYSLKVKAGAGYIIDGFLPGSGPLSVIRNVTVASGVTLQNQNLTIETTGTIRVTISGVTDAFVNAFNDSGRGNGTNVNSTAGVYDVVVPAGTYTVRAHNPKYGSLGSRASVVVSSGSTTEITFTPPSAYTVSGQILSDSDLCKNGASVFLGDVVNGRVVVVTASSTGAYSVSLPNGDYRLSADKSGCVDNAEPGAITVSGADVSSGASRTLITTDSTVSGRVTLSDTNVIAATKVIAKSSDRRFVFADVDITASSGDNYSISLASGTWTIKARSDGYESAETSITVTTGSSQTVNLTLQAMSGYTKVERAATSVTPLQGGIVRDTNIGEKFEVNIPAGALGSSSDSSTVNVQFTTSIVPETALARVIGGKAIEISSKDSSGQPISALSTSSGSGATITVPYNESDVVSAGASESLLSLGVWSDEQSQWIPLSTTVDTENNTLTALTTHFSLFAPIVSTDGTTPSQTTTSQTTTSGSASVSQDRGSGGGGGGAASPSLPPVAAPTSTAKAQIPTASDEGQAERPTAAKAASLNNDQKVDLVDFSILLYNWGVPKNSSADINKDGITDLIDFSIMLYWWTG